MSKRKCVKRIMLSLALLFILLNAIAAMQAYKFTHYGNKGVRTERTKLSLLNKLKLLATGVNNPRPVNTTHPAGQYTTIIISSNVKIECWLLPSATDSSKGTVLLFHGYTSNKSALIKRSEIFLNNSYDCLLVDFMGSGGSAGDQTTIGFKEAQEVRDCYNYIKSTGVKNVYLYGSSMGAVAIMKAVSDFHIVPKSIIIECPFGTMYETICARFRMLHVPQVPMAGILLFWGGVENGFNGFAHNPVNYARHIYCPVLLQYGEKDKRVSRSEIDQIFKNLQGPKTLITYPLAGHDDYIEKYEEEWPAQTAAFINKIW